MAAVAGVNAKLRWQRNLIAKYGGSPQGRQMQGIDEEVEEEHDYRQTEGLSTFEQLVTMAHVNKILEKLKQGQESDPNEPKQQWRKYFYYIAKHEYFLRTMIILIIFNSILMGVSTFGYVKNRADLTESFDYIDEVLLFIFTVELAINMVAHGLAFFKDAWYLFDLFVVIPSYIWPNVKIIRAFRIFRAFRLFGRVESLKRILLAIFSTGPQMVSIGVVLLLLFYVFAVMFTQLFSDCWEDGCYCEDQSIWSYSGSETTQQSCPDYELGINFFGRLDYTFFTLFMLMTMDDWSNIIRMTQNKYTWAWLPIIFFIIVSAFVMLNLVIAVLCDALQALEDTKQDKFDEEIIDEVRELNEGTNIDASAVMERVQSRLKPNFQLHTKSGKNLLYNGSDSQHQLITKSGRGFQDQDSQISTTALNSDSQSFRGGTSSFRDPVSKIQEETRQLDKQMQEELNNLSAKIAGLQQTMSSVVELQLYISQHIKEASSHT